MYLSLPIEPLLEAINQSINQSSSHFACPSRLTCDNPSRRTVVRQSRTLFPFYTHTAAASIHDVLCDKTDLVLVYRAIFVAFDTKNWPHSSSPARLSASRWYSYGAVAPRFRGGGPVLEATGQKRMASPPVCFGKADEVEDGADTLKERRLSDSSSSVVVWHVVCGEATFHTCPLKDLSDSALLNSPLRSEQRRSPPPNVPHVTCRLSKCLVTGCA